MRYRERSARMESSLSIDESPLPVLVVIHGHSFDYGSGSTINGLEFIRDKRLLVISLNYRLNILGKYISDCSCTCELR